MAQLFRAPHGTPFLNPNSADLPRVASVVRRHAVDISWTFAGSNQLDWDCDTNVQCVLNNYLSYFSGGSSGIPLMHAVKAGTAGAPKAIFLLSDCPGCTRDLLYEDSALKSCHSVALLWGLLAGRRESCMETAVCQVASELLTYASVLIIWVRNQRPGFPPGSCQDNFSD